MMSSRAFLCSFSVLCVLCGPPAIRADEFSQTSYYSAEMVPRGTVQVDTRVGDVTVEGWDESRVEIAAEKVVRAGSERKAARRFERIKIEMTTNDEEVQLRTIFPPRRPWRPFRGATKLSVNYRIRMPAQATFVLKCTDGDVRIRGLVGHQEVRVGYGNVEVNLPSLWRVRSLNASTFLGYVQSNLHGETSAGFGRKVEFRNPQGEQEITVRVRFGGVYVFGGPE
ncbi:MAG: hypothetical protein HYS61_08225 [Acidobacteria bacterium]|nr:hypothetical protein [Acidobacteriota bacterium]